MRRLETIIIALSLGFYVWFVWHFGPSDVLGYIRLAGWGLVITISLEAISRVLNTIAWRVTISRYPQNLGFGELFVARIGGEAVDYITPSAQLGGQFVMALAVRNKVRMPVGLASVVIAALTEAIGQIMFIALALMLSVHLLPGAARMFWPIAGGLAMAIALAFGLFWVQTRRPFSYLWKTAANFDFARINKYEVKE
ncbi:MAG: lysylphosphatidylglycerol synthase domain-containing protein, partial [Candidatus Binataceae bacterium]